MMFLGKKNLEIERSGTGAIAGLIFAVKKRTGYQDYQSHFSLPHFLVDQTVILECC